MGLWGLIAVGAFVNAIAKNMHEPEKKDIDFSRTEREMIQQAKDIEKWRKQQEKKRRRDYEKWQKKQEKKANGRGHNNSISKFASSKPVVKKDENYLLENDRKKTSIDQKRLYFLKFIEDELSLDEFEEIVKKCANRFERIESVSFYNLIISVKVGSQKGLSKWDFLVDFNNWGHLTSKYWLYSDNDDSTIPRNFAEMVKSEVQKRTVGCKVDFINWDKYVNENSLIESSIGLNYSFDNSPYNITVGYSSDILTGEHLYPVISILNRRGFTRVKSVPIKDVDNTKTYRNFEVAYIDINGERTFSGEKIFLSSDIIEIGYHAKKVILVPYTVDRFRAKNYMEVKKELFDLGFCEIEERIIYDLSNNEKSKVGLVSEVQFNNKNYVNNNIKFGELHLYDEKIVINYHAMR
ncbi:MAG: hypothetical protein MJ245_07285 [Clostridia bacterium]|nr:hypothetical protein [Clostridia bacterium]